MAGSDVRLEPAGGAPDGGLGTDEDLVQRAIVSADQGDGVIVLGDLGSAILTVRHVLERRRNGQVRLVDAPLVEGTVAAAVLLLRTLSTVPPAGERRFRSTATACTVPPPVTSVAARAT